MNLKINNKLIIDSARLYTMKDAAVKMGLYPSAVYIMKLKGELEFVTISNHEFVIEPENGFKTRAEIKKEKLAKGALKNGKETNK